MAVAGVGLENGRGVLNTAVPATGGPRTPCSRATLDTAPGAAEEVARGRHGDQHQGQGEHRERGQLAHETRGRRGWWQSQGTCHLLSPRFGETGRRVAPAVPQPPAGWYGPRRRDGGAWVSVAALVETLPRSIGARASSAWRWPRP